MTEEPNSRPLAGRRILVVEDMLHLAWEMCDELRDAGATIVGPVGQLEQAVELARSEPFDAAVLDVALAGRPATPIAEAIRQRGLPFILVSGYHDSELPPAMAGATLLGKPIAYPRLISALAEAAPQKS